MFKTKVLNTQCFKEEKKTMNLHTLSLDARGTAYIDDKGARPVRQNVYICVCAIMLDQNPARSSTVPAKIHEGDLGRQAWNLGSLYYCARGRWDNVSSMVLC